MGLERAAFKLGVELDSDEPFAVRTFDDFRQLVVRRHTGEDQAGSFERVAIMDIDLVAMPMPLTDEVLAVDRADDAVAVELRRIGAEPHRAAEVAAGGSLLKAPLTHPLGDHSDHRLRSLSELGRRSLRDPCLVPRRL